MPVQSTSVTVPDILRFVNSFLDSSSLTFSDKYSLFLGFISFCKDFLDETHASYSTCNSWVPVFIHLFLEFLRILLGCGWISNQLVGLCASNLDCVNGNINDHWNFRAAICQNGLHFYFRCLNCIFWVICCRRAVLIAYFDLFLQSSSIQLKDRK